MQEFTWPGRAAEAELAFDPEKAALRREFEQHLEECGTLAFRVARGVLRNAADAEDVAQEATSIGDRGPGRQGRPTGCGHHPQICCPSPPVACSTRPPKISLTLRYLEGVKNAAFGVRMHAGWGVVVCMSGNSVAPEVVDRRRIDIIEPAMQGARQPYHFVESLGLEEAEHHLQKCAAVSQRLAVQAIRGMLDAVSARNYRVVGCAMLLASGRTLPSLQKILASHALIHTAEGEFFRKVVREAFEDCGTPVVGFRERELDERANACFGKAAARVWQQISTLRKTVGSPWTQDEKTAALAGLIVSETNRASPKPRQ